MNHGVEIQVFNGKLFRSAFTDNWSYKNSNTVRDVLANLGATHKFIPRGSPTDQPTDTSLTAESS